LTGAEWLRCAGVALTAALLAFVSPVTARDTTVVSEIAAAALPAEAHDTLKLIKQGGPFSYERDGIVFGNRERRLPVRSRGYYREYAVKTPGARDRGARRIVAGGCVESAGKAGASTATDGKARRAGSVRRSAAPCSGGEYYYTDDHYRSFRRIQE